MFTNPSPRPKPNSAEAHLEGFGVVITLKIRKRLIERLGEYTVKTIGYPAYGPPREVEFHYSDVEKAELADWMIRRMAEKRLKEGLEMDKTIAAARKAFLPQLMAQALRQVSGGNNVR